nr:hypothetical protein [Corynespora cassiicola]UFY98756.1 hypothetical protein [Corynespora cassiicola]UFY98773.1 hypothetical protein [Corynespora cassiicola]
MLARKMYITINTLLRFVLYQIHSHTYTHNFKNLHYTMSTSVFSTDPVVEIHTTEPVYKLIDPFSSERLIFRTLLESDFPAYHTILKEEETMTLAGAGPMLDKDRALGWFRMTQEFTRYGLFLKKSDGTEGELVGEGGVFKINNRFPEIYYLIKQDFWGKGYASEFVRSFMDIWWNLPRKKTRFFVNTVFLDSQDTSEAKERLCAPISEKNIISQRVVEKIGFKYLKKVYMEEEKELRAFWQYISPKEYDMALNT